MAMLDVSSFNWRIRMPPPSLDNTRSRTTRRRPTRSGALRGRLRRAVAGDGQGPHRLRQEPLRRVHGLKLGRPLITVACNEDMTAADLVGRFLLEPGGTRWQDGPLTVAARTGAICYLDEVVEARQDTTVVIHPLTDHRRTLPLDKKGELVRAHPDFPARHQLQPRLPEPDEGPEDQHRQRFAALDFDYPAAELEAQIVATETGLPRPQAAALVQWPPPRAAQGPRAGRGHQHPAAGLRRQLIRQGIAPAPRRAWPWCGRSPTTPTSARRWTTPSTPCWPEQEWPSVASAVGEDLLNDVIALIQAMQKSPNSRAIAPLLQSLAAVARRLLGPGPMRDYLRVTRELMQRTTVSLHGHHATFESPGLPVFLEHAPRALDVLNVAGLSRWADYGARHYQHHPERQRDYFALKSADSRAVLQRERHGTLLVTVERQLDLTLRCLWQDHAPLSGLDRYRAMLAHWPATAAGAGPRWPTT
jgi:hypothetical protein